MREILFKAKRINNGEWVQGWYMETFTGSALIVTLYDHILGMIEKYEVDPNTLSQYTGLNDKNGNKIFDNDTLWAYGSYELTVCWDEEDAMFYAEYEGTKSGHEDDDNDDYAEACDFANYEVIGNKFDNPELLTKVVK